MTRGKKGTAQWHYVGLMRSEKRAELETQLARLGSGLRLAKRKRRYVVLNGAREHPLLEVGRYGAGPIGLYRGGRRVEAKREAAQ